MSVPSLPSNPTTAVLVQVGSSCLALGISLFGLARFDLPITKYVRSVTIHLPWDQLTVPWMAFTSDMGDWIGQGWRLVFVSLFLLAIAWALEKPQIKSLAIQTLIAHGMAALLANVLKHIIGRPRPKFVHSGDWEMSFSFVSGLDSFPSGHSTASFAVATVLAKRFPVVGPLCLAIAAFVGISRVLRGSHFPTDVMGGAIIGILCGCVASASLRQWRTSLQEGVYFAAIASALLLSVLWTMSYPREEGMMGLLCMGVGIFFLAGGIWVRKDYWFTSSGAGYNPCQATASNLLMACGLAAMTTSALVVVSVACVCMATWVRSRQYSDEADERTTQWFFLREGALLGSLSLALLILVNGRGILPFR